jgi:outer membrane murein-binding lipoprotein Lpp
MNTETSQYLALLEQRITLLASLANSLAAARTGIVALDINGLEERIQEQEKLCVNIQTLDAQIDRIQTDCATNMGLTAATAALTPILDSGSVRLRETLARLNQVQSVVKKLNAEHQLLLRRSRRTVCALLNSYHSFALTYSEPGAPRSTNVGGL